MCIICIDFQKKLITANEARRNMGEMEIDPAHREELDKLLDEQDMQD